MFRSDMLDEFFLGELEAGTNEALHQILLNFRERHWMAQADVGHQLIGVFKPGQAVEALVDLEILLGLVGDGRMHVAGQGLAGESGAFLLGRRGDRGKFRFRASGYASVQNLRRLGLSRRFLTNGFGGRFRRRLLGGSFHV